MFTVDVKQQYNNNNCSKSVILPFNGGTCLFKTGVVLEQLIATLRLRSKHFLSEKLQYLLREECAPEGTKRNPQMKWETKLPASVSLHLNTCMYCKN